jgi:biopolymer transport protein ExbB
MVERIPELIVTGGPVAFVLVGLSIAATTLTLFKAWQFLSLGVGRHRGLKETVEQLAAGSVPVEQLTAGRTLPASPAARVLRHAAQNLPRFAGNIEAAREDASRVALEELLELRRYLRGIEVIAQSSPLLGLLGTVVGMIQAFSKLEASGAAVNPAQLAGGIWTALVSTALGLILAIVFSIVGAWFEGRVDRERSVMETALSGLFANSERRR